MTATEEKNEKKAALKNTMLKMSSARAAISFLNELRVNKTAERISKRNALFKIVSNYCSIGKTLYGKNDPAKYNDYMIYRKKRRKKVKAEESLNEVISDGKE